jgi:hypothetical protein
LALEQELNLSVMLEKFNEVLSKATIYSCYNLVDNVWAQAEEFHERNKITTLFEKNQILNTCTEVT